MGRILVYARRKNARAADAFAEQLRAEGRTVVRGNSKYYDGVLADTAAVYHDGWVPQIQADHDARGIPVEVFLDSSRPASNASPDEPQSGLPSGYYVVHKAPWYTVYDGDNNKVGKAKRSYEEAVDQFTG